MSQVSAETGEYNTQEQFWCHGCSAQGSAEMDYDSNEYHCTRCSCPFVELLGQHVERFLSSSSQSTTAQTALMQPNDDIQTNISDSGTDEEQTRGGAGGGELGAILIQRIVNRILGLGVQTRPSVQSTLLTVLQQAAVESGRPVGIVVRQATTARELALLTSLLGMGRPAAGEGVDGVSGLAALLGAAMTGEMGLEGGGLENLMHHIMMNDSSHAGAPPASEEAIQSLQREIVTSQEDQSRLGECCISQEAFELEDVAVTLPCGHIYKEVEIVQWLKRHNSCPVCRYCIVSNENVGT
mmetsp:Transcript_27492/g.27712  ORF Transcript_27492/g.27712 Transcript_27492/m.27712 type:complete len:297 (+) Transcript_27492:161-1051(+)